MNKTKKYWADVILSSLIFVVDSIVFVFGIITDKFVILDQVNGIYVVNNSALMVVISLVIIGILTIYHGCNRRLIYEIITNIDTSGKVYNKISRVEAHLSNYNSDTIEFGLLSSIEAEVGINKKKIQNEIWVITNDFAESNDSREGKELRTAIINNMKNNVTYYYIVPGNCVDKVEFLCNKLNSMLGHEKVVGSFNYIADDALDFIPTEYFDILMYLKRASGDGVYAESSSQIYYCFSRSNIEDNYYYLKVSEKEIKDRMINYAKDYKSRFETKFIKAIQP